MNNELPPEVMAQMKKPRQLKSDLILKILKEDPRPLTELDDIVREFYLATGKMIKRHTIVQLLYELRKKELVETDDPGKYFITKQGRGHIT